VLRPGDLTLFIFFYTKLKAKQTYIYCLRNKVVKLVEMW